MKRERRFLASGNPVAKALRFDCRKLTGRIVQRLADRSPEPINRVEPFRLFTRLK
jgi:hypothetical protein